MPRILLVDDDIELTELLAELLSLEGFEIHCVHNGQDALTELELQSYDLILLDVMMPVLMLSARDDEIDRVLGLELGADDYLPKPFNDRELVARIKAILRRTTSNILSNPDVITYSNQSPEENSKQLSFGGVELHPGRQQAIFEGRDLDLTGTEFALLQMLMRNPGQILSRELLSLEILGKRLTPYDRAIDMHISNLRKKLPERNDNLPWFKTLRGRGYLLVTEK
ncbi:transcriptional regulatory protein CpxR [Actinobacillus pleuropneumoniae serovar 3 str. JL03]|uniref:Transcriptional regulatory protein CpxR n=2 Tax=Actinobacillus pleuropneumoniae TaxID=715 RepID=B0BNQ8_ACTPJ|nr:winged helix-turn-helix domain-containing protein [Actinobacillus pleuropneumoniae]ABY69193.1 transcriptional regulatory protein CpxR [Actinobacillus pleuropneumoniae serovar 3 str. JL03]EFL77661.1 transcriptional regulatory protein CpxR [Actinobacillus pleuropneumoniae serovar 2 str. 4226]EFM88033.1 Transcriptional regulatory protein cpxR [Actinobacillus pleuropneumoniae serovar 2 str. S1536]MEE3618085.1 winged helix-turn-helix domain-containing protein [Actinobacillus pleuropneumoniae]UKH